MPVELGQVVEGIVTGITDFGAFIQLPDGKTGLCHISEIADEYVKSVKDYLKDQQAVKVKVIEINPKGKVSLSIRKANENLEGKKEEDSTTRSIENQKQAKPYSPKPYSPKPSYSKPAYQPKPSYSPKPSYQPKPANNFEDMISKYLKDSDEKLRDFKKTVNKRRGNGFNRKES